MSPSDGRHDIGEGTLGAGSQTDVAREEKLDWPELQEIIARAIRLQIGSIDRADLDDCIQEAAIRLLRHVRREVVRDAKALATTIGQRTAIDWLRRARAARARLVPLEKQHEEREDPARPCAVDRREFMAFLVLEFFKSTPCRVLAEAYLAGQDWKTVASTLHRSYDAVRQEWSRCRKRFLAKFQADSERWLDRLTDDE